MSDFTVTNLVDDRVFVRGTDKFGTAGETVLDGGQWAEVNSHKEYDQATEAFEKAVEDFFAPLIAAASEAESKVDKPTDSLKYVVLKEGVEGQPAQAEQLIKLTKDSMVLRLLEQGDHDRLVWVGEGIEILEVDDALPFEPDTDTPAAGESVVADED